MSDYTLIKQLRQKALDTLEESSELFERAFVLLQNGHLQEAEKMKELARSRRNDSVLVMREANRLEDTTAESDNPRTTR